MELVDGFVEDVFAGLFAVYFYDEAHLAIFCDNG